MDTDQHPATDAQPAGPPVHASPGLSVGAAAARLGVAASTLRTWQRRYGLAPTARSPGGHRRYLPDDVRVLEDMARLVLAGHTPSAAAAEAMATRVSIAADPAAAAHSAAEPRTADPAAPERARPATSGFPPARANPGRRGGPGGNVLAVPGADPLARGLARAAVRLDSQGCTELIQTALQQLGVERAWDEVLRPVLVAAGAHWARTGRGVEVEHLLTEAAIEATRAYGRDCPPADERPPALLACAPTDQHSLPLYVLAAALAERRHASCVLGTRVPPAALSAAVRRLRSRSIFLWAQLPDPRNASALDELPVLRPRPLVVVGGPGWTDDVPQGASSARSLGDAARLIAGRR